MNLCAISYLNNSKLHCSEYIYDLQISTDFRTNHSILSFIFIRKQTMLNTLGVYVAVLLTMFIIDMVWLGVIAKTMYANAMGSLLSPNPNLWAAGAFI